MNYYSIYFNKIKKTILFILLLIPWLNFTVSAAEVTLSGTLLVITCRLNNEKTTEIDFGDAVGVNKIDGENYMQPVPISVTCSTPPGDHLHFVFSAQPTNFDQSAIATDNDDLGIRLLSNGKAIQLNDALKIDYDNLPDFSAVPIKRAESTLSSGKFQAIATLIIKFE